jgi:hypothetical protein
VSHPGSDRKPDGRDRQLRQVAQVGLQQAQVLLEAPALPERMQGCDQKRAADVLGRRDQLTRHRKRDDDLFARRFGESDPTVKGYHPCLPPTVRL